MSGGVLASQNEDFAALEKEAAQSLSTEKESFSRLAALVARVHAGSERAPEPDVVWRVHDAHKSTQSAETIAWLAVENGYPGECEGYIPCYANIMNWLDGEYLRRHPRGGHASEAVAQVHISLAEAVKRLAGKSAESYLNPATDCGDLKAGLVPLRSAISASNAARRSETAAVIDELLARCR